MRAVSGPVRKGFKRKGFSLLEIILTLFIIVLTLMPLLALLVHARRMNQQSQIQAAAYQIGRQQLETLKGKRYGNRTAINSATFPIPTSVTSRFPNISMAGTYSIASYGAYTNPPMKQITVRVTWNRTDVSGTIPSKIQLDALTTQEPGR